MDLEGKFNTASLNKIMLAENVMSPTLLDARAEQHRLLLLGLGRHCR